MRTLTERDMIQGVSHAWFSRYRNSPYWHDRPLACGRFASDIYGQLLKLDGNLASKEDVASIIGNDSWTRVYCRECDRDVLEVVILERPSPIKYYVSLGQEDDEDSQEDDDGNGRFPVCLRCLANAISLLLNSTIR